jgi:hypothetical protein
MAYYQTKNSDLGKFLRVLENGKCWYIICPFGLFYGYLVYCVAICYILWLCIWYIFPVLVRCTNKDLATLVTRGVGDVMLLIFILFKIFLGPMPLYVKINHTSNRNWVNLHHMFALYSLKKLWLDSNPNLQFLRQMRWPFGHAARAACGEIVLTRLWVLLLLACIVSTNLVRMPKFW